MLQAAPVNPLDPAAVQADDPCRAILPLIFDKVGSQAELARKLTADGKRISRAAICQWKRVPDDCVRLVAGYTGFSLKKIRPDLYDPDYKPGAAVPA
jgi:hypothetical protein